ncbi:MAG: hypothetical protein JWM85_2223 [Acidimicrobiaceae bacterium]|nr:hypothetical protein [Acidimicrobiaceae bacterium]
MAVELNEKDRLHRLEKGLCDLILYATEGQPHRAKRSLAAPAQGLALVELLEAITAERDAK